MKAQDVVQQNLIVKMYSGSHAYGTALPTSDVDFRGIFCANPESIRTPFFPIKEVTDETEEDTKFYELNNFMKLCLDCNPNIVELIWVDESDIIYQHEAYEHIRKHRREFLSKRIIYTTTGYAMAQLKRIKNHQKYVNDPQPLTPPRQIDFLSLVFNFTDQKTFKFNADMYRDHHMFVHYDSNIYGVYPSQGKQLYSDDFTLNINRDVDINQLKSPLFLVKMNKTEYDLKLDKWNSYWKWKTTKDKKAILYSKLQHELKRRGLDTPRV